MTKSSLLLLLGALLAGGAIGYVAGTSGSDVDVGPMPDDGPAGRDRVREVYVSDPVTGESGRGSLADLLEGIGGGATAKPGKGRITGRVETEDGQPLTGVVLRAEAIEERHYSRDTSGAPPEEPDLVKAVEEMVRKRNQKLSKRCEGRTDATGTYAIEGLTDAKYRVQAYCRGWQISAKPGTRTFQMKAGETADFIAKPMVGIPVAFRTPDGTDPKRAYVIAKGGQYPRNYPWSKEHSTIYLSPGDYTLQGMAGEFGEMKSEEVEVALKAGEPMEEVVLAVDIKPGIRGKVTFPPGAGMIWCRVAAIPVIAGQEPDPERLTGSRKQAGVSMGRMEYVLADLEPGTWLVGISMGNAEVLEHRVVEIGNSMVTVDFEIPEPDPEDSVLVRVEAPDGRLLKTARVWAGYSEEGAGPFYGGSRATMVEDGSWRVPHYTRPGFEPSESGLFILTASDPKFGQKQVEYDRASTRELTIRFDPPGTLIVSVTNYRGTIYQDATRLNLAKKDAGGLGGSRMVPFGMGMRGGGIDKDGVQKMQNVAPGDYVLQVYLHGKQWNQHLVHKEDVTVKPGANRVTVALPPLYDLVALVPTPAEGEKHSYSLAPLVRDRSSPWSRPTTPKVEGTRVTFTSVPAGTYTLTVSGGRVPQRMVVTVPGAGIVRFAAQVFSAKYVTIDDETGYLGSVGLKTGDLVIGLDGVEFKDATHMGARFMEARPNPSTKLMVLRGAKRFTVVVDLKKTSGREAGGSWRDSVR